MMKYSMIHMTRWMKGALCAALCAAFAACHKAPQPILPEEGGSELPATIEFAFAPVFDSPDTKAVKTGWEDGDVVFVFFNGITGVTASPKYLKLSYVAATREWTYTLMGNLTLSNLRNAADKRLTAVYLPFANNATVRLLYYERHIFTPSPRSLYWHSANLTYEISSGATGMDKYTVSIPATGNLLPLSLPEGFVQFFLADADAGSDPTANVRIWEQSLTPSQIGYVSTTGQVVPEDNVFGHLLPGFAYGEGAERGWLFSGILSADRRGVQKDYSLYLMGVGRDRMLELKKSQTLYESATTGRAWRLPGISNWTENPGALPGFFSVSPTKQVFFSRGNLRVNASASPRQWAFEQNQWGYNPSTTWDAAYISHFGWGTAFEPEKTSTDYRDWGSTFNEWGCHFDASGNGSDAKTDGATWYTPDGNDWYDLLKVRPDCDNLWGLAQIYIASENKTIDGLLILPDDWVLPGGCAFTPRAISTTNRYTTGTDATGYNGLWSVMERAGAVFLPAAKQRRSTSLYSSYGVEGYYWSSSFDEEYHANSLRFYMNNSYCSVYPNNLQYVYYGASVRLVGPDPTPSPSHVWPWSGE